MAVTRRLPIWVQAFLTSASIKSAPGGIAPERWPTVLHEAGHCIGWLDSAVEIDYVRCATDPSRTVERRNPSCTDAQKTRAALAGPAAQALARNAGTDGGDRDNRLAADLAGGSPN